MTRLFGEDGEALRRQSCVDTFGGAAREPFHWEELPSRAVSVDGDPADAWDAAAAASGRQPAAESHPYRKAFLQMHGKLVEGTPRNAFDLDYDEDDAALSADQTRLAGDAGSPTMASGAKALFDEGGPPPLKMCTPIVKQSKYRSRTPQHLATEHRGGGHPGAQGLLIQSMSGGAAGQDASYPQGTPIPKSACDDSSPLTIMTPHFGSPPDGVKYALQQMDSERSLLSRSNILSESMLGGQQGEQQGDSPPQAPISGQDLTVRQLPFHLHEHRHHNEHGTYSQGVRLRFGDSGKDVFFAGEIDHSMEVEMCSTPQPEDDPAAFPGDPSTWSYNSTPPAAPEPKRKSKEHLLGRKDFTPLPPRASRVLLYEIHYETVGLLGKGSFGEVYSARHHRTKKMFALKKSTRRYRGEKDKNLHLREIRSVARLPPHKNLVQYHRAWQDDGHFYIVMELCTGGTLKSLMLEYHQHQCCLDIEHIRQLAHGLLSGLNQIHSHNLLHLDLKPDNLFLTDNKRRIKIGDFGLCLEPKDWDEEEGDREYLAPEILNNTACAESDIYSAGLIIFQMLTGTTALPGYGDPWHYLRSGHVEIHCHPVGQDMALEVKRMLAPEASARPRAEELVAKPAFRVMESPAVSPMMAPEAEYTEQAMQPFPQDDPMEM